MLNLYEIDCSKRLNKNTTMVFIQFRLASFDDKIYNFSLVFRIKYYLL